MPTPIVVKIANLILKGELNDTDAGQALSAGLPIKANWSRWGEEYYGMTSPRFGQYPGDTKEVMAVGELGYYNGNGWFCLFFGPTPASEGNEPRAAVPLLPVGKVSGDWKALKALPAAVTALIERT